METALTGSFSQRKQGPEDYPEICRRESFSIGTCATSLRSACSSWGARISWSWAAWSLIVACFSAIFWHLRRSRLQWSDGRASTTVGEWRSLLNLFVELVWPTGLLYMQWETSYNWSRRNWHQRHCLELPGNGTAEMGYEQGRELDPKAGVATGSHKVVKREMHENIGISKLCLNRMITASAT